MVAHMNMLLTLLLFFSMAFACNCQGCRVLEAGAISPCPAHRLVSAYAWFWQVQAAAECLQDWIVHGFSDGLLRVSAMRVEQQETKSVQTEVKTAGIE